jgi:hypothetical protein
MHEGLERFTHPGTKETMEVKGAKASDRGDAFEFERLVQMDLDVVHYPRFIRAAYSLRVGSDPSTGIYPPYQLGIISGHALCGALSKANNVALSYNGGPLRSTLRNLRLPFVYRYGARIGVMIVDMFCRRAATVSWVAGLAVASLATFVVSGIWNPRKYSGLVVL